MAAVGTTLGTAVDAVPGDEAGAAAGAVTLAAVGAGAAARQSSVMAGSGGAETGLLAAKNAARGAAEPAVRSGRNALGRLVRMLAPFRYSQYDDSDPLELEARRSVYEAVREQPGEPITAVSERADVNLSTARYHVRVLRKEDLITSARVRSCERFYPTGTDNVAVAAAMADDTTAPLLDALVRHEPASVSTLAEDIDKSPSTVTHHLQNLEDDGVVLRERAGRSVENKLSDAARAALDPETEAEESLPTAADLRAEAEIEAEAEAEAEAGTGTGARAD
jgi:DNA-binding transcriptional ArsR family regulator